MKQVLVIFLIGFISVKALGQQSVDVGFFGGTGFYLGDMTKTEISKSTHPAYGAFIRYNFNPRYALRFNVLNGNIGAEGEFNSNYWAFDKNVLDIALSFEFNFLKYIVGEDETPWSTFMNGGIGVQMYSYDLRPDDLFPFVDPGYYAISRRSSSVITPTIPFGVGIKYDLNKRIGIALEGSLRKTFSDKLDDLDDPLSYTDLNGLQVNYTDDWHNNDWTSYVGVHLVYKLIYGNKNWEIITRKKKMVDWGIWNSNRKQ